MEGLFSSWKLFVPDFFTSILLVAQLATSHVPLKIFTIVPSLMSHSLTRYVLQATLKKNPE